ncbi:DMT family transporter [Andreprevotia chitinilytica]|uniref:DMT family transporter n=1 Tax=Andreprevotia chitinilytica TaxID=396808 RepID=UPI00068DEE78|nr:DMT family transporter [Andreprevotia chitinilytica]
MTFNRYTLYLIASMALVGANVGIGKTIVMVVPVTLFALLRFVIGVGILLPRYRLARMRLVTRKQWLGLFLQALFGTFLFTLLMLYGVSHTSALAAGVITSTIPAVVIVLSWLLLREKLGPRSIIAVLLAVLGMVIINVTRADGGGSTGSLLGNALVAGAVLCESIYVILSRKLTQSLPAIDICAYTHLIGLGLMLPLGINAWLHFDFASVDAPTWGLVFWYGLAASVLSFWLWMKGIRHVPAQKAGVFTAALPVAAVGYAILFLQEKPALAHAIALVCVLGAIWLASGQEHKDVAVEPTPFEAG